MLGERAIERREMSLHDVHVVGSPELGRILDL
jgi:hypothetical protein